MPIRSFFSERIILTLAKRVKAYLVWGGGTRRDEGDCLLIVLGPVHFKK
jgi:hypothetical protein